MGHDAELVALSTLMLSAVDPDATCSGLLQRVVDWTGADRGFVVVREGDEYRESAQLRFERDAMPREHRRFSRSVVREVLRTREPVVSPDLQLDPRFLSADSVRQGRRHAAVASPLVAEGETYGVLYLEAPADKAGFVEAAELFLRDLTPLAGLFLRRALEREALRRRAEEIEDRLESDRFPGIVTADATLRAVLRLVTQVAPSDARVLVRGETGTGKELIARALHLNSARRKGPFVAVSCAALPASLLESELFGHVRGAFTGAQRDRPGRLATAHGGTLLLDEIGEMPLELQGRLLRVLETGELQRVGSDREERVDVRVVAATHRDLRQMVERGSFREDLYYRLRVVELELPPLRARPGDVPLLAMHFLGRNRARGACRLREDALRAMCAWPWPGNVRELAHAIERACLLAPAEEIGVDHLPPEIGAASGSWQAGSLTVEELGRRREVAVRSAERGFLAELLARCDGNVSRAARESGLHRSYLQRLLARHGLRAHL